MKSLYKSGLCGEMAVALHELTGLPLGIVSGRFTVDQNMVDKPGSMYFDDDVGSTQYENCHAVVVVSENSWLDVDGEHSGVPDNCMFTSKNIEDVIIRKAGREDVEAAFSMLGFDEQDIKEAKDFIQSQPWFQRSKWGKGLLLGRVSKALIQAADTLLNGTAVPDHAAIDKYVVPTISASTFDVGHDYDPSADYEVVDPPKWANVVNNVLANSKDLLELLALPAPVIYYADFDDSDHLAKYVDGTSSKPVIVISSQLEKQAKQQRVSMVDAVEGTLYHELGHAFVDSSGMRDELSEDDEEEMVEEFARTCGRRDPEFAVQMLRKALG